ncbi:MAG: hypothetical protein IT539_04800 [Bradyrhizobiaceae bacterium]|nr:hypothetical protein [Bradyrhizobiaceae bacterium]
MSLPRRRRRSPRLPKQSSAGSISIASSPSRTACRRRSASPAASVRSRTPNRQASMSAFLPAS